jgi:hypothetical protein
MSLLNANNYLHNINLLYYSMDPSNTFDFNSYVNYYLYNCTEITNSTFLTTEKNNFTFQGLLYSLVNLSVNLVNDILNNSITPNNKIINFFNRLILIRNAYSVYTTNINFSAYIRPLIIDYVKNQTTINKNILYNSIQTVMSNSTTYLEYSLVSTLNTNTPVLQSAILTDSIEFTDTYNSFNPINVYVTNTGLEVDNGVLVNNNHTNINQFQDKELVNAKFLKSVYYNSVDNGLYVNNIRAFYFK